MNFFFIRLTKIRTPTTYREKADIYTTQSLIQNIRQIPSLGDNKNITDFKCIYMYVACSRASCFVVFFYPLSVCVIPCALFPTTFPTRTFGGGDGDGFGGWHHCSRHCVCKYIFAKFYYSHWMSIEASREKDMLFRPRLCRYSCRLFRFFFFRLLICNLYVHHTAYTSAPSSSTHCVKRSRTKLKNKLEDYLGIEMYLWRKPDSGHGMCSV